MSDVLAALPVPDQARFVFRLEAPRSFLAVYNELAGAAVLMSAGFTVETEPELDGLTPDLIVSRGNETPTIVEIYTRHRSDE